jgi:hypothetical protein
MLDRFGEQLASLVEIVAGVKEAIDFRAVLGPLLELVEIPIVREMRIVCFLVRPIVIHARPSPLSAASLIAHL